MVKLAHQKYYPIHVSAQCSIHLQGPNQEVSFLKRNEIKYPSLLYCLSRAYAEYTVAGNSLAESSEPPKGARFPPSPLITLDIISTYSTLTHL